MAENEHMSEDWFTLNYDYSGNAQATFDEPMAEYFGPATVKPDQGGLPHVEVDVERSTPPITNIFDVWALAYGSQEAANGVRSVAVGAWGNQNKARVMVTSKEGTFTSTARIGIMPCRTPEPTALPDAHTNAI